MSAFAIGVTLLVGLTWSIPAAYAQVSSESLRETYRSATLDADGNVRIVVADGTSVTIKREGEQTSFSVPVLSDSKTAVGAQALFPNCCTSYDIPQQLVVYAGAKVHIFTGNDLPIFKWAFVDGGTRVAYGQEPVHSGCAVHYELRDIESEHLVASADIPQPCGQNPSPPPVTVPPWVTALLSKTQTR